MLTVLFILFGLVLFVWLVSWAATPPGTRAEPVNWREREIESDKWEYVNGHISLEKFEEYVEWTLRSEHSARCMIFEPSGACTCPTKTT